MTEGSAGLENKEIRPIKVPVVPTPASPAQTEKPVLNKEKVSLGKFASLIAGEDASEAQRNWARENIESIREAVQKGKHETGYYPASGTDSLRVLVAYDLSHLVTCDDNRGLIGKTEDALRKLDIEPKVKNIEFNERGEVTRRDINFELLGCQRIITEVYKDTKDFDLTSVFKDGKIDVLHVFLATGSDEYEGVRLNKDNYGLVREGGFFCFDEKSFGVGFAGNFESLMPSSIYGIFGLDKLNIIARHPATLCTYIPDERLKELIKQGPRQGTIFHKAKALDEKLADMILETSYMAFMVASDIGEVQKKIPADGKLTIGPEELKGDIEQINELAQKLLQAGADKDLIEGFKDEFCREINVAVKRLGGVGQPQ